MNNANEILTEMSVVVTVAKFHETHDAAIAAEASVKEGSLEALSTIQVLKLLRDLEAGQRLTNAETGPDAVFAHSYSESIDLVEREISRRK